MVIAIIAILASMLLPSLAKARDKARTIDCLNNQKSLRLYMMMYELDWNDILFPTTLNITAAATGQPVGCNWGRVLMEQNYVRKGGNQAALIRELQCPAKKGKTLTQFNVDYRYPNVDATGSYHYGLNSMPHSVTPTNKIRSLRELRFPAKTSSLADTHQGNPNVIGRHSFRYDNSSQEWMLLDFVHTNCSMCNVAYIDGHAATESKRPFLLKNSLSLTSPSGRTSGLTTKSIAGCTNCKYSPPARVFLGGQDGCLNPRICVRHVASVCSPTEHVVAAPRHHGVNSRIQGLI